ncbi:glycosyltransferase family 52 [Vibrio harveyi]|uniref:glycosyltransferase family 52 n=1 Tax=Vibrio harveyi TaxID=669 RepID=UPI00131B2D03|nr:glycosyltransferase family 52 [Vibrio harveyi]
MNNSSLMICHTPFQTLLAEQVLDYEHDRNCQLFYFSDIDNAQQRKYYNRLGRKAVVKEFYTSGKSILRYYYYLRKRFRGVKYDKVYVSSLNSSYVNFILSFISFESLITFDDGSANVVYDSFLYKENSKIKTMLYRVLGARFPLNKIKNQISRHYTIYRNKKNVSEVLYYIEPCYNVERRIESISTGRIRVFLGSAFEQISTDIDKLKTSIEGYFNSNDFYIKHPRSKIEFNNITSIVSNDIAEEIILKLLDSCEMVELYGFYSSTQLNMMGLKGVRCFCLNSSHLDDSTVSMILDQNEFKVLEI